MTAVTSVLQDQCTSGVPPTLEFLAERAYALLMMGHILRGNVDANGAGRVSMDYKGVLAEVAYRDSDDAMFFNLTTTTPGERGLRHVEAQFKGREVSAIVLDRKGF